MRLTLAKFRYGLAALSLVLTAFIVVLVFNAFRGLKFGIWEFLSVIVLTYLAVLTICLLVVNFSIVFLWGHQWLNRNLMQHAVDSKELSISRILLACLAINFTFFTLAFVLPLTDYLRFLPSSFGELFGSLSSAMNLPIPASYQELYQTQFLFTFVVPLVPGPILIFVLRWLRKKKSQRGRDFLEFLLVLFYVSLFLAGVSLITGNMASHASLTIYSVGIFAVLIPGSLGLTGLLCWIWQDTQAVVPRLSLWVGVYLLIIALVYVAYFVYLADYSH